MHSSRYSSIHNLNSCNTLPKILFRPYMVLNRFNNMFPGAFLDERIQHKDFIVSDVEKKFSVLPTGSSPSRRLCDMFWSCLNWKAIDELLGGIQLMDIGCGTGKYFKLLNTFSSSRIKKYAGLDINSKDSWKEMSGNNVIFETYDGINIKGKIAAGTNFFISQSAIEHMCEDVSFFCQVGGYISDIEKLALQIHLFPSAGCLRLYRVHGIRQYTPRTISTLTRQIGSGQITLFRLGGKKCNDLHFNFITVPLRKREEDQRKSRREEYESELVKAIKSDMQYPAMEPSFYALVISHNFPESFKLFTC